MGRGGKSRVTLGKLIKRFHARTRYEKSTYLAPKRNDQQKYNKKREREKRKEKP